MRSPVVKNLVGAEECTVNSFDVEEKSRVAVRNDRILSRSLVDVTMVEVTAATVRKPTGRARDSTVNDPDACWLFPISDAATQGATVAHRHLDVGPGLAGPGGHRFPAVR
jgi:hypothetical protein